jgi:hypothetical protein
LGSHKRVPQGVHPWDGFVKGVPKFPELFPESVTPRRFLKGVPKGGPPLRFYKENH